MDRITALATLKRLEAASLKDYLLTREKIAGEYSIKCRNVVKNGEGKSGMNQVTSGLFHLFYETYDLLKRKSDILFQLERMFKDMVVAGQPVEFNLLRQYAEQKIQLESALKYMPELKNIFSFIPSPTPENTYGGLLIIGLLPGLSPLYPIGSPEAGTKVYGIKIDDLEIWASKLDEIKNRMARFEHIPSELHRLEDIMVKCSEILKSQNAVEAMESLGLQKDFFKSEYMDFDELLAKTTF